VREVRKRKGWTAAELARRLGRDRSTVTDLERGERVVSLDDAFAYAGALGVHPSRLIAPLDNTPVEVWPGNPVDGHIFRAWLRANAFVRPDDAEYFPAEVDCDEWLKRCQTTIRVVAHSTQQLIDSVDDAIDADSEAAEAVRDRMEAANAALESFARTLAERENPRPVARQRVRRAA
jgi:transcriptional regulator with XRE-family HTH domain